MRWPVLWRWAMWFAAFTGLTQAFLIVVARAATHRLIFNSADVVWMAPLADAGVFGIAAIALQFPVRRLKPSTAAWLSLSVFLFLFLIGPLSMVPRLQQYAGMLLAAGIATQGARWIGGRTRQLDGLARRTLPLLVCLSLAFALVTHLSPGLSETLAVAPPPPAERTPANVLLIVLDTVRAQSLNLYGYGRQTSGRLNAFAERGVVFDRAFSTAPWTLPSHGSMFTGRFPHELTADWLTPLDRTHATLAELLGRHGYVTAGFVGNLLYTPRETGLSRGFFRYQDYPVSAATTIWASWLTRPVIAPVRRWTGDPDGFVRKRASEVNDEFFEWLDSRPAKPFFAFLNYFDAHAPYVAPAPFNTMFGDSSPLPDISVRRGWTPREIQRSIDAYDATLAYLDHELGRLVDGFNARHLLETTLIVITSDHGEQFGEHGLFDHANSLYRQALQVPLVISFPGRAPAGKHVTEPVSLVDLPATIIDLAEITDGGARFPGRSLGEYWRQPNMATGTRAALLSEISKGINLPPWVPASRGAMQSVIAGGMHYIRHADGTEELYDFERDVAERDNISGRPDVRNALEESRLALDGLLTVGARTAVSHDQTTRVASRRRDD